MSSKRPAESDIESQKRLRPRTAYSPLEELAITARGLADVGKGLLAADESTGTIKKRFDAIHLENTEENRRAYRELLFGTEHLGKYISGCILYEETLYQKTKDGKPFTQLLVEQGVIPGIKVDMGLKPLPGTSGEVACQGLTDLDVRFKQYYDAGARFAKWRAAFTIDIKMGKPSLLVVETQARDLARYAGICQTNGLVPIVEPEVLMDGEHDISTCARVSEQVLSMVIFWLHEYNIFLEGCLLKPNMVTSGQDVKDKAMPLEIAEWTLRTLKRTIPPAIPGIMFLSGGQTEEEATLNLDAINKLGKEMPWRLSFSYGRALQASTLEAWRGNPENVEKARAVLLERCKANSAAQMGSYAGGMVNSGATKSLYERGYIY